MTSTPFNIGLGGEGRPSSRVLHPPGGGHTDIFGPAKMEPVRNYRGHAPTSAENAERNAMNDVLQPEQNGHAVTEKPQETAPAPIPEEKTEEPAPLAQPAQLAQPAEQPEVAPPRRVRVPPGGFSSKLW